MTTLQYQDLTEAQKEAIALWWEENDPDGYVYDYVDNRRYAVAGNIEQQEAYDDLRMGGCCGFLDVELDLPDGSVLWFGFNYGH